MRSAILSLILAGLLLWSPTDSVATAAEPTMQDVRYQFGQFITFSLEARSDRPLVMATLFFGVPTLPNTYTAEVTVSPADSIRAEYTVDLTDLRLTPFADVTYRWAVTDAEGAVTVFPEQAMRYEDDRFLWRSIEREGVIVHWAEGEVTLGQAALDVADEVLPDLQAIVPAALPTPLHIYLYPTASDLQAALRLTGQSWVGGHASPELGVVLIAVPDNVTASAELQTKLPHELSHVLLAEATGSAYERVPVWFGEGLATFFELTPSAGDASILSDAVNQGKQHAFADLCVAFPDEAQKARLAYAQSADMIRFLRDRYGNHALTDMIRAFADGAGCESAVTRTLGVSLRELDKAWQESRRDTPGWLQIVEDNGLWLILFAVGFVVVLAMQVGPPGRNSRRGRGDE
jgi:hypothetical protein